MKKIFIIHGWTYSTDAWNEVSLLLQQKGYEVQMLKVPGLTEGSDKVWTLDEYVEWLHAQLLNESDVTLVGHSNGGRIAIAHVSKYPGKISKLILIDAAGIVHNEPLLRFKRSFFKIIATVGRPLRNVPVIRKIFYKAIGGSDYGRAPENMRKTMAGLITIDLREKCKNIQIPVLIIWGKLDTHTPVSDAYLMHKGIQNSKLVVIDDARHSPHKTHPERVVDEIVTWV
jgi:pimeloyl-ACP methyl ester carboxylesterase